MRKTYTRSSQPKFQHGWGGVPEIPLCVATGSWWLLGWGDYVFFREVAITFGLNLYFFTILFSLLCDIDGCENFSVNITILLEAILKSTVIVREKYSDNKWNLTTGNIFKYCFIIVR